MATISNFPNARIRPTFTVGAENTNVVAVGVQFRDERDGNLISERVSVTAFLSTDAEGEVLAPTAPSGGVAVAGGVGLAVPLVTNRVWQLVSDASGQIDLEVTETGAATWYLVVVNPDGTLSVSGVLTFAT